MRRGDICLVNLDPIIGSEANKRHPCVVVSNDNANESAAAHGRGVITVVPLTSNTDRVFPFQVFLAADETGLDRDSKAQAEQIRSVDVRRVGPTIGHVPLDKMLEIGSALRLHLQL